MVEKHGAAGQDGLHELSKCSSFENEQKKNLIADSNEEAEATGKVRSSQEYLTEFEKNNPAVHLRRPPVPEQVPNGQTKI